MSGSLPSVLAVRRSIYVEAPPDRVWREFETFERMSLWWGLTIGPPVAGSGNGQRLVRYEPRVGGRVEMEVLFGGAPMRYGGAIVVFDRGRELTFESDWMPNQGWLRPTLITFRLTPVLDGTLVELFHHGFERTGGNAGDELASYEGGWAMTQLVALRKLVAAA
ncbi:MAG TPA: SRPBCC domain-containing protein [Planctomycetota bacterium]|nr:SRPBCC domain-containing protein [Planctomycetota bacterium]